jgi:tRNA pseudouridine55 synthase
MTAPDRYHGLLIIDKPAGWTSHDVVGRTRRLLGQRSVGHAGTLDPAATGVLPVAVGSALRAIEYLSGASKSYRAEITFGIATDTLDAEGRLIQHSAVPHLPTEVLESVLQTFLGPIEQVPPVYSAIKIDGTPFYERARRGEEIEPPTRSVVVNELRLIDWTAPVLTVDIDCSKGFYVRSFARDIGERVGSCAYLSNLVRTRVGDFDLCDAWTLTELSEAPFAHEWERIAIAPDATASHLPVVILDTDLVADWEHGKRKVVDAVDGEGPVRVYDSAGVWLGIGALSVEAGGTVLHPRKVIATARSNQQDDV